MKVLGLDVGARRIGVAKADSNTRIAVPVGFLTRDGSEWLKIGRFLADLGTNWLVLGLPRSNSGGETQQTEYVREFAKELAERFPEVRIDFEDESLTSVEAEERLILRLGGFKNGKKSYERGEIDAEAATIILQDFLERYRG
ncbi:MAG: Holliday junction resolvase RuvX [Candidatus Saccharibacteria bacterium]|nr:Holliday junction resolvase RuvX [Candidatus Saccharibacteria bacterium]